MKTKIITIIVSAVILSSCASGTVQMNRMMQDVYIGMTLQEFKQIKARKELVAMREDVTIYRVSIGNWYDTDGSGRDYRYFYFEEGKLARVDKGQRAVDYRIRID